MLPAPSLSIEHQADAPVTNTSMREWLSVFAVAISAFAFVTSEFLPVGLLPHIAQSFGVTTGAAGLMVTTPGVIAAIAAPAMMLAAGRVDRRHILLMLTACLLVSNVIAALAPNLPVMLAGRALLGASLGGFWTLAMAAAGSLVQQKDSARAMAIILAGVTCATVIGVPIGTYIASVASWRVAFAATGALVALALVAQFAVLPSLASTDALRVRDMTGLLRDPVMRKSLLLVPLVFGAHFCSYTYITPFLLGHAHFAMSSITWLLLGFGAIGFVSNLAFSTAVERDLKWSMCVVIALLIGVLVTLPLLASSQISVGIMLMIWGVAFGGMPLCCSVWMQRAAPNNAEAGAAMFVSIVQVAIAIGSSVGGYVVDQHGTPADFLLGAAVAACALVVLAGFRFRNTCTPVVSPKQAPQRVQAIAGPTPQ